MIVVAIKDVVEDSDVVLAAIAALEVCGLSTTSSTILLCLSVTSLYVQIG